MYRSYLLPQMILGVLASIFRTMSDLLSAVYRDLSGLCTLAKVETKMHLIEKKQLLVPDLFRKLVKFQPNKPCIVFNDEVWTFQDMEDYSNKVAELFQKKYNLKKGDCVALLLENKPEYIGLWLGLSKLGVISALINTNLKHQQLIHSFNVSIPKVIVYSSEFEKSIYEIKNDLDKEIIFVIDGKRDNGTVKDHAYLNELLAKETTGQIVQPNAKIFPHDIIMYIYTSGTTGLPKPAVIKHNRYSAGGFSFFDAARLSTDDVVLVTLPIYHANGVIIGVGSSIISGATVVLRKKFSASNFWKECIQFKCTAFIYVGEICRFLVNQPPSKLDQSHTVRKAIGNGLRANVWKEFHARFNVKCIEFYAASEGNCTMVNTVSKIGACGFLPLINKYIPFLPVHLIKIDADMNPIRDKKGFCIPCRPGETGLLIGIIGNRAKTAFNGYANNTSASNKKIIEDVFKKGQRAFNSGDALVMDRFGYMFFCDRLGDTYRWRGENVSTIEVENVISKNLNSAEVVVYGVEVPGEEGKAGMAAIVSENNDLDMSKLASKLSSDLPSYAMPLFVRLVKDIEHTGSFKVKKMKLVEQGFNITQFDEKAYFLDSKEKCYKELTVNIYQNIINGNMRF